MLDRGNKKEWLFPFCDIKTLVPLSSFLLASSTADDEGKARFGGLTSVRVTLAWRTLRHDCGQVSLEVLWLSCKMETADIMGPCI